MAVVSRGDDVGRDIACTLVVGVPNFMLSSDREGLEDCEAPALRRLLWRLASMRAWDALPTLDRVRIRKALLPAGSKGFATVGGQGARTDQITDSDLV